MAVYIDQAARRYGRMLMAHLTADSSIELHQFAAALGLRRHWFQDKRLPHYDCCKNKRQKAIMMGAIAVTSRQIVKLAHQMLR